MARVKPKRHGVVTDMTAMCDVAFLLLTFFILTTQFKKPDVEQIKPPSSISETILDDANLMTIGVTKDGKFYFQPVANASERRQVLESMGKKYGINFSEEQKVSFGNVQTVSVPMNQMRGFLDKTADEQKNFKSPTGVPMDSLKPELRDWVKASLDVNPKYQLALKGDVDTKFPKVRALFEGLRDIKSYKLLLITSQEGKPNE